MTRQHNRSRLPAIWQGENGYEATTTKRRYLPGRHCFSDDTGVNLDDTQPHLRDSLQRWWRGTGGFHGL